MSREERSPRHEDEQFPPYSTLVIVGAAGQTGTMYATELAEQLPGTQITAVVKDKHQDQAQVLRRDNLAIETDLPAVLQQRPEALLLATGNPTQPLLELIAQHAHKPLTIILPQNATDVTRVAKEVFQDMDIRLIRGALLTNVSMNERGEVIYKKNKLRIGLAGIPLGAADMTAAELTELQRTAALFAQAKFDVEVFEDFQSLQWTKLVVNLLGHTAAITGLGPEQTFRDPELRTMEIEAHKARLRIMAQAGIDFAPIPWNKVMMLKRMERIPTEVFSLFALPLAKFFATARNHQPPAAARKIEANQPNELLDYHQSFIDLATSQNVRLLADEAMVSVYKEIGNELRKMNPEERKRILLDRYRTLKADDKQ